MPPFEDRDEDEDLPLPEVEVEEGDDEDPSDDGDDDGEGESSEVAAESSEEPEESSETPDEREAIRERRRQERRHRKEEQRQLKAELAAMRQANNELTQRLGLIERRGTTADVSKIDEALGQLNQAYSYYQDQIRIGTESANGQAVADATSKLMQVKDKASELARVKQAYLQSQNRPQPLDPRLVDHAKKWMGANSWYDPNGRDIDSRMTLTLDNALAEEGFDPRTPAYWDELSRRVKKYLPHRATAGYNKPTTKPRSPVSTRPSGAARSSTGGGYELSADRVQALKDSGLWDDPKLRSEAIKRFKSFDSEQARSK